MRHREDNRPYHRSESHLGATMNLGLVDGTGPLGGCTLRIHSPTRFEACGTIATNSVESQG